MANWRIAGPIFRCILTPINLSFPGVKGADGDSEPAVKGLFAD
jgi:hypothetical protein